ncbi:hypothetical protein H0H87_002435 [Tephrocybe sp. NHM501043]|nr:hypothetical protein H0H87_002435 [Tephrocybe sp. NHM501043]
MNKVSGLPLVEFNQLKLQFLLLNNFCLVISSTEMQCYIEQLILFSSSADPQTQQNPHLHMHPLPPTHPHVPNLLPWPQPHPPLPTLSPVPSEMEGETEAEMEMETETEADTETTNNESTIRPRWGNVASASMSDVGSIYSGHEAEEVEEE